MAVVLSQSDQNTGINQICHQLDLRSLINQGKTFIDNPIIAYLNINNLVTKVNDPRKICKKSPTDILCLDQTIQILDDFYPDCHFRMMVFNILLFEEIEIDMEEVR